MDEKPGKPSRLQFGLTSLMGLIAAVAIVLALSPLAMWLWRKIF
jgi:hypothetical protein